MTFEDLGHLLYTKTLQRSERNDSDRNESKENSRSFSFSAKCMILRIVTYRGKDSVFEAIGATGTKIEKQPLSDHRNQLFGNQPTKQVFKSYMKLLIQHDERASCLDSIRFDNMISTSIEALRSTAHNVSVKER